MNFTTAKHDCMQFILSKSSLILFKTRYPLVVYHENADVIPFIASISPVKKLLFTTWGGLSMQGGHMVLLWKYGCGCVLVKFLSSSFFKRYYKSKDIQAFSCNWTTSTFLILNFGFGSLN